MKLENVTSALTFALHPNPATFTIALLQVSLLLWAQMARAAFQLPPFLQTLSERTLTRAESDASQHLYTLPASIPGLPNMKRLAPRKKNLKPHKLRRRLRKDWDEFWMSAERPPDLGHILVRNASADPDLQLAVDKLNLTLPEGVPRDLDQTLQRVLGAWLMQRATCSVHYVWDDLGELYWPRFVRRGFCRAADAPVAVLSPSSSPFTSSASILTSSDTSYMEESCSWPPGMHCVPAQPRTIRILRWQCQHSSKQYTRWYRKHRDQLPTSSSKNSRDNKSARDSSTGKFNQRRRNNKFTQPLHPFVMPEKDTAVGASKSGKPNEVERRLRRETRYKVGGGAVVKNHTERDVIPRERQEEEDEEETNETENFALRQSGKRRKNRKMRCRWKKIPYPVTDDCYCSC